MGEKSIIKGSSTIIFDYKPKEFPVVITPQASGFVNTQEETKSEFVISAEVAQQIGISKIKEKKTEELVEAQALKRLKEVEEKAYKEAYDLGLIEGTEKAFLERKNEFESRIKMLDEFLITMGKIREQLFEENEHHLLKLVYLIASKIAMREVTLSEDIILDIIKTVIDGIQENENINVYISNEDYMFIESVREKVKKDKKLDSIRNLKFEPSDDIKAGGCLLETQFGVVDASLDQRVKKTWEAIESKLPKSVRQSSSSALPTEEKKEDQSDTDES